MQDSKRLIKRIAREFGFDLVGVTSANPFHEGQRVVLERLEQGLMGQIPWYTEARVRRGCNPEALLPGSRSIISVAVSYWATPPIEEGEQYSAVSSIDSGYAPRVPLRGRVARYAWGRDYHNLLKARLKELVCRLERELGTFRYKWYVDDGPMLDREVAWRAGVGFFGKNTNILTQIGSWVFLGQVLTDLELEPDRSSTKSCGACTACMPSCPTGAIVAPYVLDSNRCISYLTIENRGPIPRELRPLVGDWVYGCDICQEVCPVNHTRSRLTREESFQPRPGSATLDLLGILALDEEEFRQRFHGSPVRRAKRVGLQRNACVVLGNMKDPRAVTPLVQVLHGGETLVRGHAAWALGRIGGPEAITALKEARDSEREPWVLEEIVYALHDLTELIPSTRNSS